MAELKVSIDFFASPDTELSTISVADLVKHYLLQCDVYMGISFLDEI